MSVDLDPSQRRAVDLVCDMRPGAPRIAVITGGPGTGKTTSLRAALDRLDEAGVDYVLASPTGKAARRMQEATGRTAGTVHRLLEYDPMGRGYGKRDGFLRHAEDPVEADLVVIDESSMLDIELAHSLLDACGRFFCVKRRAWVFTRIVLVGDKDQLPPVGPGRPFADLIASDDHVPVARLTTLHRAAAASWVCTQSREILAGRVPDLAERPDFRWRESDDRGGAVELLEQEVVRLMGEHGPDAVQALIPQNVGPAGCARINVELQAKLNPASREGGGRSWKTADGRIYVGDQVIQTRNDYLLDEGRGVMNGECGRVASIGEDGLVVCFDPGPDERRVRYSPSAAKGLRLAYALTCHKAQGSEWAWVVVLAHSTHTQMLSRGWLYTAVTRAKTGVVLVGDRVGVERAVKNARDEKRNSGLVGRLKEGIEMAREASEAMGGER